MDTNISKRPSLSNRYNSRSLNDSLNGTGTLACDWAEMNTSDKTAEFPKNSNSQPSAATNRNSKAKSSTVVRIKQEKMDERKEADIDSGDVEQILEETAASPESVYFRHPIIFDTFPSRRLSMDMNAVSDESNAASYCLEEPSINMIDYMTINGKPLSNEAIRRACALRRRQRRERFSGNPSRHPLNSARASPIGGSQSEHPINTFFKSMTDTVMSFPPLMMAETRLKVCQIVTEMETRMLTERLASAST